MSLQVVDHTSELQNFIKATEPDITEYVFELQVHLSLPPSSHGDVINGIDELRAAPLGLGGHHQEAGEGKHQARNKSSHFGRGVSTRVQGLGVTRSM